MAAQSEPPRGEEINDPEQWRAKAAEARRIAKDLSPDAQVHMIAAADSYDRVAALLDKVRAAANQSNAASTH